MLEFYAKKKSKNFRYAYRWLAPYTQLFRRGFGISDEYAQPFFIVGCGRSGTTLLRKLLFSAEEVYVPPETYVLGPMYYCFIKNRKLKWPDLVDLVLSRLFYHPEFHTHDLFGCESEIVEALRGLPKRSRTFGGLVDGLYQALACHSNQKMVQTWGDKTPLNTLYLDELAETFPNGRFIHLVRDGRDVVNSYTKNQMKPFSNSVDRWVSSMLLISDFALAHPEKIIEIRYEDLVTETDKEMGRICNFIGLAADSPFWKNADQYAEKLGDVSVHHHHANIISEKGVTTRFVGQGAANWDDASIQDTTTLAAFTRFLRHYGYNE